MLKFRIALLAFISPYFLIAQKSIPNSSVLSIEQIMQGTNFVGTSPSNIFWSNDAKSIYFSWNPEQDTLSSLYKINIVDADKIPQKVSIEEQKKLYRGGVYTKDRNKKLITSNGDIFLVDTRSNEATQLTNTIGSESNARFTTDEKGLSFVSDNNLYYWSMENHMLEQLTNIQKGNPRKSRSGKSPEFKEWLEEDQLEYFEVLRWRKAQRAERAEQRAAFRVDRIAPIYIGEDNVFAHTLSPDLRFVSMIKIKAARGNRTKVPNFVTESGYIEDINARVKVGSPQSTYELLIYDRERDTSYTLDTKQIPGIYDKPVYKEDYHKGGEAYKDKYDKPRKVFFTPPIYSEDGKAILVVRAQDNKDRWIFQLIEERGELKLIDRQHDDAWIAGPGIGWSRGGGNIGWMPDNKHIWYQSEKTGYSNLYVESRSQQDWYLWRELWRVYHPDGFVHQPRYL